jgi:hypothetical protein
MRYGLRKPSFRKSFAARTSLKRVVRHSLGVKAPRGWGWMTNPRRALYNRMYNRTTFGWSSLFKTRHQSRGQGCALMLAVPTAGFLLAVVVREIFW